MIAYKFLAPGRIGPFSGFEWPEGEWVRAEEPLDACRSAVHACRVQDLPIWLGSELWEIELDGQVLEAETKLMASAGRLVRRVDGWKVDTARDLAAACAQRIRDHAAAPGAPAEVLAGYVSDAEMQIEPATAATAAYIAARAALRVAGLEAMQAERAWQADWLADRLALRPAG